MAETARRTPVSITQGSRWSLCPPRPRFSLRVDLETAAARASATFPVAIAACRAQLGGDWAALWLGPDEQLLIGPEHASPAFGTVIADALRGLDYSLVDVSHRQGAIEVTGPHATALINAGCPLDLGLAATPVGFCSRTVFAKAEIVLWRCAEDGFQLQAGRSFLPYVTALLALAAQEYGG